MRKYFFLCSLLLLFTTMASSKIVFVSTRNGETGIYSMDDNGNNVKLLTDMLHPSFPSWSPDGKQIVFDRRVEPDDELKSHLFLMNADGSNIRQLTLPHEGFETYPSFSPDGKSIVFYSRLKIDEQKWERGIYVLNLNSGVRRQIFDRLALDPHWSPDGKRIVFTSPSALGASGDNIYIIELDEGDIREILPPEQIPVEGTVIERTLPRWSPDSKKILYVENEFLWQEKDLKTTIVRKGHRYIICDLNGNTLQQLDIPKNWRCARTDWMNNGESVILSAHEIELDKPMPFNEPVPLFNIYKFDIQTGKTTPLTENQDVDVAIDWISDTPHSVSHTNKQLLFWGNLKQNNPLE